MAPLRVRRTSEDADDGQEYVTGLKRDWHCDWCSTLNKAWQGHDNCHFCNRMRWDKPWMCPACRHLNPEKAKYCEGCGRDRPEEIE